MSAPSFDPSSSPKLEHDASSVSRRRFVAASAVSSLAAGLYASSATAASRSAQDKVVVGVMGLNRGMALVRAFSGVPGVEVKYLCEADSNRLAAAKKSFEQLMDYKVIGTGQVQDILDDPDVDALVCAAPNHWHAPAAIMACNADKHCYVEKPCSHNPWEGEMAVAAARKNKRCVQMGNQRRSAEKIIQAMQLLHEGRIGRVYYSRSWYANLRGPIGEGMPAEVPPHLDYELWQGPAPRTPYTTNKLPYTWHWFWDYGNGELGNNGIHSLDLSRWGLQVDYPSRVVSSGGRYRFDDDQQTPDTHVVSFEFEGDRQISWECLSCNRLGMDDSGFGVTFHGEDGSLKIDGWGYTLYDQKAKVVETAPGNQSLEVHVANFIDAVRANDPDMLNAEIEEGHKSTLLCHLGNIAHRTGDTLNCDPINGHIQNNPAAEKLWKRDYEPGWEPRV